ncbi:hypothetical protein [Agrobacterium pusense]|uniref:Uncharacterized protein n=1 Tax=Agrobacterium pusense TaxID=648995 RepID=A0AA44EQ42_9HYPH|nr:hypothetical protein [Agrobacterium pusense]NRF12276.1 hypothetical protein [Agrobacterium pusense]NRF22986.1 hypothetical protein [Agrobacterium pusense]
MSAWATTIISGLVLVVAFMQWRTAHQKVMLDLFDRRLEIYRQVWEAVGSVVRSGRGDSKSELAIMQAADKAMFLFGRDVSDYLKDLSETLRKLEWANRQIDDEPTQIGFDRKSELFRKVVGFYEDGAQVFHPYMRMDQKRVRTPAEWFADRNRIRLSHADDFRKNDTRKM